MMAPAKGSSRIMTSQARVTLASRLAHDDPQGKADTDCQVGEKD